MQYTKEEVIQFVQQEDVKFIRLAFCDVYGKQKNISILSEQIESAFAYGVAVDSSAIAGFGGPVYADLLLHPEPDTLSILPWRPEHGRVVRMYCHITYADGKPFECDTRSFLKEAVAFAQQKGVEFQFGSEQEFYLFELGEDGEPTGVPYDKAGYMDIAPEDRGENIRREICLTLEQMGISPESSHHEEGPGQNEIDFMYSNPLTAADNVLTLQTIVKTVAHRNGLYADFSPKPLAGKPGNGFHITVSLKEDHHSQNLTHVMAGILDKAVEMTVFLNPADASYDRLGREKAPKYVAWSSENRSQFMRLPSLVQHGRRAELRSPDSMANPYLAYALLIYAGMEGIEKQLALPPVTNFEIGGTPKDALKQYRQLPESLEAAQQKAAQSEFIREIFPEKLLKAYI
ncbi:MAG: glutamine synthetase [Clostridia bacterium]|nr:glutamine synthetase [Clostridia bacterium]